MNNRDCEVVLPFVFQTFYYMLSKVVYVYLTLERLKKCIVYKFTPAILYT